ncbi:AAA family ATPase [Actinokineospora terrae]|uniref:AAA ATPase domain-containing protein n=1 Tax=Actinokineospora terrae TaxID=155974 RepID=A0A1H9TA50_9PSEU|nr:ATP-binding protein [Actinokineospora terrae]SER94031.1 AAA ATPase domain-containing protein [Actinokineospora terrae]
MSIVARRDESRVLDELTRSARGGQGGAVVVVGAAGMGTTALVDSALAGLDGWLVLRAAGSEFERDLPYSCLRQLCAPVVEQRAALPAVQRKALESVFGLGGGTTASPLVIGLAVLGLLHELARRRPVCCVVDDAQWADEGTRQVLAFVARRVGAERIAVVIATRAGCPGLSDLPHLPLSGLGDADARSLLRSTARPGLDDEVLDRIVAEAGGNPLALLEFGRDAGPLGLPVHRAHHRAGVAEALEAEFARRAKRLPSATRTSLSRTLRDVMSNGCAASAPTTSWSAEVAWHLGFAQ